MGAFWNFWYHYLGLQGVGPWYGAWSGIVPSIEGLTFFGFFLGAWHHVNCSAKGCPRLKRHTTSDGHGLCHRCLKKPLAALDLPEVHEDHK